MAENVEPICERCGDIAPDDCGHASECESCGNVCACVELLADPFLSEVYEREEEAFWCRACFRERAGDI